MCILLGIRRCVSVVQVGIDVAAHVSHYLGGVYGERFAGGNVEVLERLVDSGCAGKSVINCLQTRPDPFRSAASDSRNAVAQPDCQLPVRNS